MCVCVGGGAGPLISLQIFVRETTYEHGKTNAGRSPEEEAVQNCKGCFESNCFVF